MSAADPGSPAGNDIGAASVDADNPWLGLASFTEETRSFFFGREQEVAELQRRVQGRLLTVLFGKSGLGKTSILQAGLVPRLRDRGYFPVYLRIDYGHDSPEPAEQIKQAIGQASAAGQWTQTDVAAPGESIWEFLHHRDDVLKDASGATLTPLLILDQFEELFTLAQSDESGRVRAARFIEELADLVENRPPRALEARLDTDEGAAERFDFARSDYRVVIALREDYLAPLESLKKQMPSLSQNRLRLAPMTGTQALEAVLFPGKHLVSQEVAEAIVRFVAGGAELGHAEVEPSLLSLICRELNEQRIARRRPEISQDLLAGSHDTILSNFYERCLADQPATVRRIIEDDLLTESGYRENLAEESLLRRFQAAGAGDDALAKLVNRRLLRIEERLDVRRVELTHDVLTGVVKASRDQRHEREAHEATERMLTQQRARESAARHALRRARAVAAGCTVLAAVAVAAAILAWVSVRRAQGAEQAARQTRAISEQARAQAEGLLGFLTDDFVSELETFGRYQTVAELSQREIDYFRALPAPLEDPQSIRSGALAFLNHAEALLYLGDIDTGAKDAAAAIALLVPLRRGGDRSESTAVILGRAYMSLGALRESQGSAEASTDLEHATDLLRPIAGRPDASVQARRIYVEALSDVAQWDWGNNRNQDAVQAASEAMRLAVQLGAHRDGDIALDSDYAYAGAWRIAALDSLGRDEDALRIGEDLAGVADQVLAQRPQYGRVLFAKQMIEAARGAAASDELDPAAAMRFATQNEQTSLVLLRLEPGNTLYVNELGTAYNAVGDALWSAGRLRESITYYRKALDEIGRTSSAGLFYLVNLAGAMTDTGTRQARLGDPAGAAATVHAADAFVTKLHLTGYASVMFGVAREYPAVSAAYARGDFDGARRRARSALAQWQAHPPEGPYQVLIMNLTICRISAVEGRAEYRLGDFAAAAQSERAALRACQASTGTGLADRRRENEIATWLSMALARAGKPEEAARTIGPVLQMYRMLDKKNRGDEWLPLELASALYAQALADGRQRPALLREAAQRIGRLAPNVAALPDARTLRALIREGQRDAP